MKGIDIYSGNEVVDFNAIKNSGVEVVYIKATEGITYTDCTYKDFYNRAKAAGLKVGFYHFLRANDPVIEAEHFLNAISGLELDCKCAIDVEVTFGQGNDKISSNVRQFADYLKAKGIDTCIYTYTNFYKNNLNESIRNIPLWVAEYGVDRPNISSEYVGFQHSENGSLSGINGDVDLNEFGEGILIGKIGAYNAVGVHSESDTIKIIQQQLNTLLKKGLTVDGIEGECTISAIKEFQGVMGLVQDGIWGQKTVSAISEIFSKPVDGVPYPHYEYATRYIQYRVGGKIDGVFGNGTKVNVQNWQAQHGLSADGVVGADTWSKLLDENC
ncbi:peptidoglycan-binding protein [Clostridium felsineum]|uniref:GH25 family lysozyme n=1 Tax=Clostridium felsineum TaxID=36839 RepID=UPI00214DD13D|nr:GH25 family lysozyme [Clostridium felsineum]MCR3760326.1 peptidoglycan-binding protein [Clostridium felsineum]